MGYKIYKSAFSGDEAAMRDNKIEDLISKDEEILWEGRPKKGAYVWSKIVNMLPIVLIWLVLDGFFIGMIAMNFSQVPTMVKVFMFAFFALHLLPVWMWIANIIKGVAEHKNMHYVMTDRRLFIRSGIIPDVKIVSYVELSSVRCRVGLLDRLFKVGDIYIATSSGTTAVCFDVADPYRVTSVLQKIIEDVKSDTYYPNALRPETNPGYRTKYRPE